MNLKGELQLLAAYLLISTFGIFSRELNKDMGPLTQVSLRFMMAAVLFFILFSKNLKFLKIKKKDLFKLFIAGFFGYGIMVVLFVLSYLNTTYANATTFTGITPLFVVLLSLFIKEKIDKNTIVSLVLSLTGIFVIFRPDFSNLDLGMVFAMSSAFLYATFLLIIRGIKKLDIKTRSFYSAFFGGFLLFPLVLFFENTSFNYSTISWIYLGIMAVLNVISFYLIHAGLENVKASTAGIIGTSMIIFGVIISVVWYKEAISWFEIIGSLLILLSIVVLNIDLKKLRLKGE